MNSLEEGDEWSEDDYLTDVKTGFTFKIQHFESGELTKAEEKEFWQQVLEAKTVSAPKTVLSPKTVLATKNGLALPKQFLMSKNDVFGLA